MGGSDGAFCEPSCVTRRRILIVLGAVALVAILIVGLGQSKGIDEQTTTQSAAEMTRDLAGSPPRLAALHAQANELLDGNAATVQRRIASLKGFPVVVNMWGSWCPPCRLEMPFFQKTGVEYGKKVAFLGLNVQDPEAGAKKLLKQIPLPYPSCRPGRTGTKPPDGLRPAHHRVLRRSGKQTDINLVVFPSPADLAAAGRRYALGETVPPVS